MYVHSKFMLMYNIVLGMIITVGQGTAYVLSGMYGDPKELGMGTSILIITQLFFAGIVVIILVFSFLVSNGCVG